MATDVTNGRLLRLPWDYDVLGLDPDEQLVADAVRASISIPLYFDPVIVRHGTTGARITLVDGGVLSNYPIEIFDRTDLRPPRWPTLGVKVVPELPAGDPELFPGIALPALAPVKLLEQVVATAVVGNDQTLPRAPVRAAPHDRGRHERGRHRRVRRLGAAARGGDRERHRRGRDVPGDVGLGRVPARLPAAAAGSGRSAVASDRGLARPEGDLQASARDPAGRRREAGPAARRTDTARPSIRTCGASSVRPAPVGSYGVMRSSS